MELPHIVALTSLECSQCGGVIGLSRTWVDNARALGDFKQQFWCPYCGERQGWGVSQHEKEVERLAAEKATLERRVQYLRESRDDAQKEAAHFRRSRDGMKGQLVRTKKRVSNGVCPCCNRHFARLADHMKTKHPNYGTKEEA